MAFVVLILEYCLPFWMLVRNKLAITQCIQRLSLHWDAAGVVKVLMCLSLTEWFIQDQLFVCFKKEYTFIGIGIPGIWFYDMEFIKILKKRHLNGKFLLFKIKDQILLLPVISGSKLHSHQLYNFLYNSTWCNKKKTDSESENLSSSSGSSNTN